jgi:competence protein ComEC
MTPPADEGLPPELFPGAVGPDAAEVSPRDRPALPRPMFQVALAWIAGLCLGRIVLLPPPAVVAAILIILLAIAAGLWRTRAFRLRAPTGGILLLVALTLAGALASNNTLRVDRRAEAQDEALSASRVVRIEGRVVAVERWGEGGTRLRLARPAVVGAAALVIPKLALDAELYVGGQSAWDRERGIQREAEAPLDPADWIGAYVHAWARPFAPSPQAHPWAFHAREFQRRRGVAAAFRVNSVDLLTALEPPHPFTRSLHRVLESVRRHLRATAAALLSPEVAALVTAVVMGERGALPDAINEHFRTAGLTHLLVVSGLHTGFMLAVALVLARFARLPPRLWILAGLISLIAFTALVGFRPPVVRASVMGAFVLGAWWIGRPASTPAALAAAAFVTLLADPRNILRADWQLSYSCVLALTVLAPPIIDLMRSAFGLEADPDTAGAWTASLKLQAFRFIVVPFASVLAILMGLLPFQAAYFGQMNLSALFSNLVAIPLVGALMIGALALPLMALFPGLDLTAGALVELTGQGLLRLTRFFAETELLLFRVSPLEPWLLALYAFGLLLGPHLLRGEGFLGARTRRQRRHTALRVGVFLLLLAWLPVLRTPGAGERLELYVLDVGQGDALVLMLPRGRVAVIDAGGGMGGGQGARVVVPFLRGMNVQRLAFVAASHADADHVGGLDAVLNAFDVGMLLHGPHQAQTLAWNEVLDAVREREIPSFEVRAGDRLRGFDPVALEILGPWPGLHRNDASVVMLVRYGEIEILLTGDIERSGELRLVAEGVARDIDVLKVAHHGSATSTTREFLEAFTPEIALISAGRNNRFGHPAADVVERLSASGAVIARTDHSGTLRLQTDGRRIRLHAYGPP